MKPLTTFSGFERVAECPGSVALPHAEYTSPDSTRGTVLHAYLEAIGKVGPDEALAGVPEEWRDTAAALDLTGLDDRLGLAAEVSYAYDCETDTARELGRGLHRDYSGVTESEIPGTLDVVGIDQAGKRGLVLDWKTGWQVGGKKSIKAHWQLEAGALALARVYDLETVEVQLVFPRENGPPIVKPKKLDVLDLDLVADSVREVYGAARAQRELAAAGKIPTGLRTGEWCTWCPARMWCPARTSLIRAVVGNASDEFDDLMKVRPLSLGQLPDAWRRVRAAKKLIAAVESAIYGAAREKPVLLGRDDDGTEHWLGHLVDEGNERIDGEIAFDVIEKLHSHQTALDAVTWETTKAAIERALKPVAQAAGRGKFAGMLREVLEGIRERGGVTRPVREGVREYTVKKGG